MGNQYIHPPIITDEENLLDIYEAALEYGILWDTFKALLPNLSQDEIAIAISITVNVCPLHIYPINFLHQL